MSYFVSKIGINTFISRRPCTKVFQRTDFVLCILYFAGNNSTSYVKTSCQCVCVQHEGLPTFVHFATEPSGDQRSLLATPVHDRLSSKLGFKLCYIINFVLKCGGDRYANGRLNMYCFSFILQRSNNNNLSWILSATYAFYDLDSSIFCMYKIFHAVFQENKS